jgi:hypothetical protein
MQCPLQTKEILRVPSSSILTDSLTLLKKKSGQSNDWPLELAAISCEGFSESEAPIFKKNSVAYPVAAADADG